MPIDRRKLKRTLNSKLYAEPEAGRDHDKFYVSCHGHIVGRTQIPRGSQYKTIDDELLDEIARQLRLHLVELKKVDECTIDFDEYCRLVSGRSWRFRSRFA